jgi:ribonuclease HI
MNIALKRGNHRKEPAILNLGYFTVTVFSDSQAAIRRIRSDYLRAGQSITKAIIAKTVILAVIRVFITIKWVFSYIRIERNERADKLTKKEAEKPVN